MSCPAHMHVYYLPIQAGASSYRCEHKNLAISRAVLFKACCSAGKFEECSTHKASRFSIRPFIYQDGPC